MKKETLELAKNIEQEIKRLESEVNATYNHGWRRLLKKVSFVITHYDGEYLFDLTKRDLEILRNDRIERIKTLRSALDCISDDTYTVVKTIFDKNYEEEHPCSKTAREKRFI